MNIDKKLLMVWLNHIGGITYNMVLVFEKYFGTIEEIWKASEKHLNEAMNKHGIIVDRMIKNRNEKYLEKILADIEKNNIKVLAITDHDYPEKLKNIYNPPYIIYIKGNKKFEGPLIGIVGARKATAYGRWAAFKFAKELGQLGIGVVSGLALGIDTESHKGVLNAGGYTIAVLGCGIDQCYPSSNQNLYNQIGEKGCIMSEYCPGTLPLKHNFPARNRIISGLTDGVIVIEAAEKSGALITVEHAISQGREVYALPGNINSAQSKGTNKLIKEGAKPLLDIDDIIEDLGYRYPLQNFIETGIVENDLSNAELKIFRIVQGGPKHIDLIHYESGYKISELSSILTILEIKGLITQLPGKIFTANK